MKRLQLRHLNRIFENRNDALSFLNSIVDPTHVNSEKFGESLYAEPMVVRYTDENNEVRVILAIGTADGQEKYHVIDSANLEEAISELQNLIGEIGANIGALSGAVGANMVTIERCDHELDENVRDEYVLKNNEGQVLGEHIKIYKDSSLLAVLHGYSGATGVVENGGEYSLVYDEHADREHEFIYFVYSNPNGEPKLIGLDFERVIIESEVGNGLMVGEDHKVAVKIDDTDEGYLSVSENGLKTEGIADAIESAITEAKAYADTIGDAHAISSKDIVVRETASGITLAIQADEKTITKYASASTIYDTNTAVFGTLLTMAKVNPSSSSIKDAYELQDGDGNRLGARIEISKNSALYDVRIGHVGDQIDTATGSYIQTGEGDGTLNFVYHKEDGTYELTQVVISDYFTDAHFGKGLQNHDGVISIATPNDERFLWIGEDVIGTSGITEAIANAKAESNTYTDAAISGVNATIDTLATKESVNTAISSAKTEIFHTMEQVSANTLSVAKGYTDDAISTLSGNAAQAIATVANNASTALADAVSTINGNKVVDVVYDADQRVPKYIQLRLADGTLTDGFDASEFLVDGVLENVTLEGNDLVFVWNDDEHTEIRVPLSSLADIYTVASGSVSYLMINGTEVSAIVDKELGYAKTLASTDYVDAVDSKVTTLSAATESVTNAVNVLNGPESTQGSVLHIIDDKFAKDIITAGLPATDVTIEDAKQNSLLRVISVDGVYKYYATSLATDMYYVPESGANVELNSYITGLKNRIADLEAANTALANRVTALENAMLDETDIKNIIKSYLAGTPREIKLTESGSTLNIGFADDAIFGDYLAG